MEKVIEALESLISKTGCMNDTCAHLGDCLKDNKCRYNDDNLMCPDYEMAKTLKNALTELKQIKEAKPSEALECLGKMIRDFNETTTGMNGLGEVVVGNELVYFHKKELETIEQALLKAQEQEEDIIHYKGTVENLRRDNTLLKELNAEYKRVLEIIKEKCLYTSNLNEVATCLNYNYYKERMSKKHDTVVVKIDWNDKALLDYLKLLTEEEFNTLKRWREK